jgi:hypothetical protein
MIDVKHICIHGHFYQPPRGNPFNKKPLVEPDAAPYKNWNERITAECYEPNASIGNFGRISFNIGETLTAWLAANAPDTYAAIIGADEAYREEYGVGNAIAQPMHHAILPLSRRADQMTQVSWGKAVFQHRFGRPTHGIWLPEMAVDFETLSVLVEQGIGWTILTKTQVEGADQGAGPYWVNLPDGGQIRVFVRDEALSNDIAFNLGRFGGAGRWAREMLVPRRREAGALTLIATDGETFGHHWPGEEQFLYWLLKYEAGAAGYGVTTLERYAASVEPVGEVILKENTSWSCSHGLARWATGCPCTPGSSAWKGALRRALDNLRFELDAVYFEFVKETGAGDALALRDAYIDVVLGKVEHGRFLEAQGVDGLSAEQATALLKLVEAQFYRQRMYASCTFFFSELTALSTVYGIANAAYAVRLTHVALGVDLSANFRRDLRIAASQDDKTGELITGADIYDDVVGHFGV